MNNKQTIIRTLRQMIPARPLTLSEAYTLAELQATRMLRLIGAQDVPVDVGKIAELPKIEVRVEPRHRMTYLAGFSQWTRGKWLIVINGSSVEGRRRFTLAHEFKHVLDHTTGEANYAGLGHGDKQKHDKQIEQICDYFAACLLMPAPAVKKLWYSGIQKVDDLALHFKVSSSAMKIRLTYLGFLDEQRPARSYFRSDLASLKLPRGTFCPVA